MSKNDLAYRADNCEEIGVNDFDMDGDIDDSKTLNMNSSLQHLSILRQLMQNDLVRKRGIGLYNTEEAGKQGPADEGEVEGEIIRKKEIK